MQSYAHTRAHLECFRWAAQSDANILIQFHPIQKCNGVLLHGWDFRAGQVKLARGNSKIAQ